jgi:large conductance mechanosensitive channel
MLKGFKAFVSRGNVIDLAVGVVIGAAFSKVVDAFVEGILGPIIGWILPGGNLSDATFEVLDSTFYYGAVLQALIVFLFTAAAVYFFVVVPVNKMRGTEADAPTNEEQMIALLERIANKP